MLYKNVYGKSFPGGSVLKNPPVNVGDEGILQIGKIPWGRKWQHTPVFLIGKSRGQRSLEGYSPWGSKESDMTEHIRIREKNLKIYIYV